MSEELDRTLEEDALGRHGVESMVSQPGEHFVEMFDQLLGSSCENIDIVQITDADVIQQVVEDVLHETTKGGRSVSEAERHPCPLEKTSPRTENGTVFSSLRHPNLPVSREEVDGGEVLGAMETVECILHVRHRVGVLLGNCVGSPVVDAETEGAVFLLGHTHRRTQRRVRGLDDACLQHLVEPFIFLISGSEWRSS